MSKKRESRCWCGEEKIWCVCFECGGEGWIDETETDPFDGDPMATCPICLGAGGWYTCLNTKRHKDAGERFYARAEKMPLDKAGEI